ncbi:hypothetical protein ANACOL_04329 [Anaerotruncus colihominis DSM 17241]|uniref:Uncharacterized protein n=1 Tax=Anaerotruncus colihominis DSM 17241 TaxID=445972 RepID=B0PHN6_9FIRM|nr:hypothetical protein ANACOL_04329 [Anaerotruncus colihominis DSM 17241]
MLCNYFFINIFVHEHNYAIYIDQPVSNPLESGLNMNQEKQE